MKLIQYPQDENGTEIEDKIVWLEKTAWPSETSEEKFPSAPDTYVTSFVLLENGKAICHVGIRKSVLFHKNIEYSAYGLSEVVTHPDYRRMGFGTKMIRRALDFIISENPDISIFTCEPERVRFYTDGGWQALKSAVLVGGTKHKPFRSDSLGLITMIKFISEKGIIHKGDFQNTDIFLELGEGQLW